MSEPFTATNLRDVITTNKELYDAVCFAALQMGRAIDRAARFTAKANAEWHDDPTQPDHADYHAPHIEQFPADVRKECAADLLDYFLSEFHYREADKPVAPAESGE